MVTAKGAYMVKDIERLRNFYGIPLKPPSVSCSLHVQCLHLLIKTTFIKLPETPGIG